jgi:hypothetical protein
VLGGLLGSASATSAAAPSPCNGIPQITDPSGDGHHSSSDVLGAWLSEEAGRVQAVIQVRAGTWLPEHDDAEVNGSGFVFLFAAGGQTQFVRATAPPAGGGPIAYDYGTYSAAGGFASVGSTSGEVAYGTGGTVTIDVPAATGAVAGAVLSRPFVLTYDGITGGVSDWVDHGPGGTAPDDPSVGADYVVGSCNPATAPTQPTALSLTAPGRIVGGGRVLVRGRVAPALEGVAVTLTRAARRTSVSHAVTGADGGFAVRVPIPETTRLRAVAGSIGSQTLTVTVRSRVRIAVRRLRSGRVRVSGRFKPALPGRVLLLRTTAVRPTAQRRVGGSGRFRFGFAHLKRGRYQAVYIPSGGRAERSTSNKGVVR